jgi:hypothetical protein
MVSLRRGGLCAASWLVAGSWLGAQEVGSVLHEQEIARDTAGFSGELSAGDRFGSSLAALGDLDGDGAVDLAAGARSDDAGGRDRGAVWVVFRTADGSVREQRRIARGSGGLIGAVQNFDGFGSALATLADLDGDGLRELAVGAPGDDDGPGDAGAVWVLFLGPDGSVRRETKISALAGGGPPLGAEDAFGTAVLALADMDADGIGELAVGAPGDDDGGTDRGAVWVAHLRADGSAARWDKISATAGGLLGPLRDLDRFGTSLAALGDLDGDGAIDVAVGAAMDNDTTNAGGAVWTLFLDPAGAVMAEAKIDGASGLDLDGYDRLGTSLASPGDLDGDGVQDLLVGAVGDDDGGINRGAVWVLFLERSGNPKGWSKISDTAGNLSVPLMYDDAFGVSVAALGDLDGDRKLDVAVGAPGDDTGGAECGALHLLYLESTSTLVERNGSGLNPRRLSAQRPPAIGEVWEVLVDGRGKGPGLAMHEVIDRPFSGLFLPSGEVLIDPNRPLLARRFAAHQSTVARLWHLVPPDPLLVGLPIYSQALVGGTGGEELTNALDAQIIQ